MAALGICLAICLVAAGCGDDDESGSVASGGDAGTTESEVRDGGKGREGTQGKAKTKGDEAGGKAGNNEADAGGGRAPASEDFTAQANRACAEVRQKMAAEFRPYVEAEIQGESNRKKAEATEEEIITDVFVPGIEEQIERIEGLDSENSGAAEAVIATLSKIVDEADAKPVQYARLPGESAEMKQLTNRYSLPNCGRP